MPAASGLGRGGRRPGAPAGAPAEAPPRLLAHTLARRQHRPDDQSPSSSIEALRTSVAKALLAATGIASPPRLVAQRAKSPGVALKVRQRSETPPIAAANLPRRPFSLTDGRRTPLLPSGDAPAVARLTIPKTFPLLLVSRPKAAGARLIRRLSCDRTPRARPSIVERSATRVTVSMLRKALGDRNERA